MINNYLSLLALTLSLTGWSIGAGLENFTVVDFLRDVRRWHGLEYVVLMRNQNATIMQNFMTAAPGSDGIDESIFVATIMHDLETAALVWDERAKFRLYRNYSDNLVTIVVIDGTLLQHTGLLDNLVNNLLLLTYTRVLFLINLLAVDEQFLAQLFAYCWKNNLPNVVAIYADYQESATFYSYTHFPEFEIERKPITVDAVQRIDAYPYRLSNLQGYKLPIKIGGVEPRIIPYVKLNGEATYKGPVGHLLDAFKQKYNCQYVQPLYTDPNHLSPSHPLIAAVRNGSVELATGITFSTIPMRGFSYPYELLNWCIMLPMEADVPAFEFYVLVFELSAFLLTSSTIVIISMVLTFALYRHGYHVNFFDFIVHDNCLRGAMGQSFNEVHYAPTLVRGIYLQICVLGILLTTWYNSYFSAYVTSAPKEAPYRNFDDFLYSKLKIVCWEPEYLELVGRLVQYRKYESIFLVIPDFQSYAIMRDSFNTDYGYLLPSAKWNIVEEQQKVFTRRLFRWRTDMCVFNTIPMGFPMHENSIYLGIMKMLILRLAEAGLSSHWEKTAFGEMIAAGKLSFSDLTPATQFRNMQVADLQYVFFGYAFMVACAFVVFVMELIWNRRRRFGKLFGKLCCKGKVK